MDDLMRLPSVSRIHFIECGANTGMEWGNVAVPTVQYTHGMLSCCEFTGVPLSTLLDDCGVDRKKAKFVLAEGADGSGLTRTIAMERALDDAIVAWGMNGEMLRPENGYPLRLVVPGVQGVSWVKWLRRIEVGDQPWYTREETLHYVDLMPDGMHRQYTSIQEAKSVITSAFGRPDAARQGLPQRHRPGLVGPRQHQARRRLVRRRAQLAHRAAGDAGAVQGADALQHRLGLGRRPGDPAEPGHRRNRLRAARDAPAARGARHALDLSQQRHPVLAGGEPAR